MPGCCAKGRGRRTLVQADRARAGLHRIPLRTAYLAVCLPVMLAGCGGGSPAETPAAWFHNLEGGQIAANRPPPPGAGMPYPKIGTVPPKPKLPDPAYRRALQDQLMAERDRTQRLAADTPIAVVLPPPPKPASMPAPGSPSDPAAAATLDTADTPPPSAAPSNTAPPATETSTITEGPAAGSPVILAGGAADMTNLPPIPDAPPPPATFEGVAAEPAPTPPPPISLGLAALVGGTKILFPTGQATLDPSQNETLKSLAAKRGHQGIEVVGGGEAVSDTPEGQGAAIELGLRRAHAVAAGLQALHVPAASIRLAAFAFGRGATVRLLP